MKIWLLLIAAFVCLWLFVHFTSRTADKYANIPDELKESFRQLDADMARARVIDPPKERMAGMVGFYTRASLPHEAATTTNLIGASASAISAAAAYPHPQYVAQQWPPVYKGARFEVMFIEEGSTSTPVITVAEGVKDCDEVIVTTFYEATMTFNYQERKLLLSKTSVIPCLRGSGVAADAVPVTKDKIRKVRVKLTNVTDTDEAKIE